ncbi:MAG TPA: DUF6531 domain-containing protein [Solirubrobacteraceae bacterium]|nr:DUF6531 domain-containing protein [Solirubrobacteraceae bacterium]
MSGLRAQGRRSVVLVCLALVGLLALSGATSADPTCTVNWTGGVHDSLWTSAGNWSSGSVPSSSDRACVTTAVTVKVTSGVSRVGSLSSAGTLMIAGGSLELTSASTGSSVASLTVQSGTMLGAGALTVSSVLSWTGGTLSGAGSTVLASGATGTVNPGNLNQVTLDQRTLVNQGTLTWSSGSIVVYDSAEIDNSGTWIANAQYPTSPYWTNAGIINEDASASWVHNTGTFKKTSGSGATTVQVAYDNAGTTLSSSGQLGFYGGSHGAQAATGSWSASGSASLAFSGGSFLLGAAAALSGTIDFTGASVQAGDLQGAGATLVISAGSLGLTSAASASSVAGLTLQSGGTLTGAGTLNVSSTFSWTGGTMAGTGSTALGSSATGTVNPGNSNQVTLDGRTLANHGTLSWSSGSLALSSSAEIDNSGTFNANAQYPTSPYWTYSGILNSDASSPWVHNTGTFKKASGTGTTTVQVAYDNEGTTSASAGQLGFYAGGEPGQAATGAWSSTGTASLALNGGSFALGAAVALSGTINFAGASVQAGDVQGASAATLALSGGSLELTSTSTASSVYALTLSGGVLQGAGTLSAAHTLTWTGGTMSGAGVTTLASGATGTVNPGSYNQVTLDQRTLRNQGTLTWSSGSMALYDGAEIDNSGTFNANAQYPTSPYWTNSGVFDEDGSGAWVHDTGTFKKASGSGTTAILAAFDNQGSVLASSGQLAFYGGSYPGHVAYGSWTASAGASLAFTQGSYLLSSAATLSGTIYYNGGTVTRTSAPSGSLQALTYATGSATVSGTGASTGSGFASATIELTPAGQSSWQTLCGPLSPDLAGAFSCTWNTVSGSYPDGAYQLRAQLADSSTPASVAPTVPSSVLVDNTAPSGSLTVASYLRGAAQISGSGADAGAGVASWQPQITPAGQSSWQNACSAQTTPLAGGGYGCTVASGSYQDGSYQLRAVILDHAGNGYTTASSTTIVDNAPPTGTLAALAQYLHASVTLSGSAGGGVSGVASWAPQVRPAGGGSWQSACTIQTAPSSGSTYSCAFDTTSLQDGSYELRALVTNGAGSTYGTQPSAVIVENALPSGTLTPLSQYVSGASVLVAGSASDPVSGIAGWQLQIAPVGQSSWQPVCPPAPVTLLGTQASCTIDTTQLPDVAYQLRALITNNAGGSYTTAAITTTVDNNELSGALQAQAQWSAGAISVQGTAFDPVSSISSWQLQIAPAGQSSWQNACGAQSAPQSGSTYGCSVDTSAYGDGDYQLRALETDALGNSFTTPAVTTTIDNHAPALQFDGSAYSHGSNHILRSGSLQLDAFPISAPITTAIVTVDGTPVPIQWDVSTCFVSCPNGRAKGYAVTVGRLNAGQHTITAYVTDTAGNHSQISATVKAQYPLALGQLFASPAPAGLAPEAVAAERAVVTDQIAKATGGHPVYQKTAAGQPTTYGVLPVNAPDARYVAPNGDVDTAEQYFAGFMNADHPGIFDAANPGATPPTNPLGGASSAADLASLGQAEQVGADAQIEGSLESYAPLYFELHRGSNTLPTFEVVRSIEGVDYVETWGGRWNATTTCGRLSCIDPARPYGLSRVGMSSGGLVSTTQQKLGPYGWGYQALFHLLSNHSSVGEGPNDASELLVINGADRSFWTTVPGELGGRGAPYDPGNLQSAPDELWQYGITGSDLYELQGQRPYNPSTDGLIPHLGGPAITPAEVNLLKAIKQALDSPGGKKLAARLTAQLYASGGGAPLASVPPGLWAPDPVTQQGASNPAAPNIHHGACGDPVDCATGNFYETQTDLAIGGRGLGLGLTRTYNSQAAARASAPGPFGYGWSSSFSDRLVVDQDEQQVTLQEANGSAVSFASDGDGGFSAPAWVQATLTGTPLGGYLLTQPDQTVLEFDPNGSLLNETDRNGNTTTLGYDGSGQLASITDPSGRQITLAYSGGLVSSATDPLGHTVHYGYTAGNLTSVTLPGDSSPRWQFQYDGSNQLTTMTDGRGATTTNVYDSSNRVSSQTDRLGHTLTFAYDDLDTRITNHATGSVTDEQFNDSYLLTSITHGYGTPGASTRTISYDVSENPVSETDGDGHTTTYAYDQDGNKISTTDPDGNTTSVGYDNTHDVISTTTPGGETTTIDRDGAGNAIAVSRPAPAGATQTTAYAYDADGQLTSATDPLGHSTTFAYDAQGDRVSQSTPAGRKTTWAYDVDSRVISSVSPRGNVAGGNPGSYTSTIARDAQGRPVAMVDALGQQSTSAYDANGNVVTQTDPKGSQTTTAYDAADEPITVTRPDGSTLRTSYDGAGGVASQTDGNNHATTYTRDAVGNVVDVADPLGRHTAKTYDRAGNLLSMADAAGRTTTYSYDAAGRLTQISYSDGTTPSVHYGYDADGRRVSMSDGTGSSTYAYDVLGRLTQAVDGHGDTTGYGYDIADERTRVTYPGGSSVTRAFDSDGQLQGVADWLGNSTQFSYDADGDQTAATFPAATGESDQYGYDAAGGMSSVSMNATSGVLASLAYTRDADGQVTQTTSVGLPGAGSETEVYDLNNRLTQSGSVGYGYDAAGNVTQTGASTNGYDSAGELTSGTGVTYSYDQLGERTQSSPAGGPVTSYGYDQAGNMTSVSRPAGGGAAAISDTYAFDGNGLRAAQTIGSQMSYLTWDASGGLPLLLGDGGHRYVYGPGGLPVEQVDAAGNVLFMHHDQQGSTRMLTDSGGVVQATLSYDAYGNPTGSTGTATTALGYDGQYTDKDTGLLYLRARSYDPLTAQFLSLDPLQVLTGAPYGYVDDNPLTNGDPTGQGVWSDIAATASVAALIPGLDVVAAPIAIVTGGIAAGQDIAEGKYAAAVVDASGTLLGGGGLVAQRAARIYADAADVLRENAALSRSGSAIRELTMASRQYDGYAAQMDYGAAATSLWALLCQ